MTVDAVVVVCENGDEVQVCWLTSGAIVLSALDNANGRVVQVTLSQVNVQELVNALEKA